MTAEAEYVYCNLCKADQYTVVTEVSRSVDVPEGSHDFNVRLVCCCRCGLVYWNPRKTAKDLEGYYASVYRSPLLPNNVDESRRNMIQSRVELLEQYAKGGSLLEIGSAEGFFLQKAVEEGFVATGIEPSVGYSRVSRCLAPKAKVFTVPFESYETGGRFDVICSFFVLEHTRDAKLFLSGCYDRMLPDGVLYLEVPDVELYPSQLNDMIWHEHTYHFTHATIARLLAETGFKVVAIHSPGPSYQFGMAVIAQKDDTEKMDKTTLGSPDPAASFLALQCFRSHLANVEKYRAALRLELDPLLERVRSGQCRLAVYGTGIFYSLLYTSSNLQARDITALVDDNKEKWGRQTHEGLTVESPVCLAERNVDIVLIASDSFEAHMTGNVERWSHEQGGWFEPFRLHTRTVDAVMRGTGGSVS